MTKPGDPSSASSAQRCPIVGVGASSGGLEAFRAFLSGIPRESGLAYVFVQHLAPDHPSHLHELLATATAMPVHQVTSPQTVAPDHLYVVSPGTVLRIRSGVLQPMSVDESPAHRAPIDFFLRSLAADQGGNAAGVILCGAGGDGAVGIQAIRRQGGLTLVQSPDDCLYDAMPRAAVATGMVDYALPLAELPGRVREYFSFRRQSLGKEGLDSADGDVPGNLPAICSLLAEQLGHDFSRYKQSTLIRRIQRRMQMGKLAASLDYIDLLKKDPQELQQLFKDLLISVTEFFRDSEAFEKLSSSVFPKLATQASPTGTIRVWVAGCATGQEAYSLAILLREYLNRTGADHAVQIFATDIDVDAVETARQGFYGDEIEGQVSEDRLQRFFKKLDGGYQVVNAIREMCVFSVHNLIHDPPFSRMDLVSCRNVLIYFESALQQRVIPLFHYALKASGYLLLGPAESLGTHADSFRVVDKKMRIFQAKSSPAPSAVRIPRIEYTRSTRLATDSSFKMKMARERDAREIHERILLEAYAPPSVLVDATGEVLHYVHRTSPFLEPPVGVPSHHLFDIVRDSLRVPLRAAFNEARVTGEDSERGGITVRTGDAVQTMGVLVKPLKEADAPPERYVVIFIEESTPQEPAAPGHRPVGEKEEMEAVQQLEKELRSTKEWLQATIEELENSNEELKSSNEELISINEEYQSANESLQTSKEEFQSLNEELETVNAELSKKLEELDQANADIDNFFSSTAIPTVFLDEEFRIKKYTPAATSLLNLIEADLGRPLTHVTAKFDTRPMFEALKKTIAGATAASVEVATAEGRCYSVRTSPYRTLQAGFSGTVVNFIDITELKQAESKLRTIFSENQELHELGLAFATELDTEPLVQRITDVATALTKAQFGAFFYNTQNASGESYMLYTISGVPREAFSRFPMPRNTQVFHPTFTGQGPVRSNNITKDPRYGKSAPHHGMPEGHLPVVSYLAVPVVSRSGEVLGGLFFGHAQEGVFDERAETIAVSIAAQAAVALDNARMFEELRRSVDVSEASERRFRKIADSMPQIVWMSNPEGEADYFNHRWYEYTGLPAGSLSVDGWKPVVHVDDYDLLEKGWRKSVASGEPFEVRARFFDKSLGRYQWHLCRALPVRDDDGEISRWFGTCTDINDLVDAELMLKHSAERKDEFLAMLGHELRNPLAPLKSGVELLSLPYTSLAESVELRQMMQRQVQHLTRIVDDLLDVSRISKGKIVVVKEPLDLAALARSTLRDYELAFSRSGPRIRATITESPLWVNGDSTRISQIFSNLLHNATKFTRTDGFVYVDVFEEEGAACVVVHDTGIGMTPGTIENLFQPFVQADNSLHRSRGGLGLGLALVKGLVELHQGAVKVASDGLELGSTFRIEIPLTEERPTPRALPEPGGGTKRIVVIEDNDDAARTLTMILRKKGHQVFVARNGRDGVDAVLGNAPDAVICDIGLPDDFDGYKVARELRERAAKGILLIALTGYGQEQDQKRAVEAGFDVHFTKPLDIAQLEEALATAHSFDR